MRRGSHPNVSWNAVLCGVIGAVFGAELLGAEPAESFAKLGGEYRTQTHALLKQFCLDCHKTSDPQGELDLERFATIEEVRRGTAAWIKAAEMLDLGEMPPKDAPQPTAEQKKSLRGWITRYLRAEAFANAGDPGAVPLRRLNNAEYTYTVQDLTGVDLRPAREFPADSAAGEGFTNAGAALVMSPALLTKYFDAGKEIAAHAVLLPDGFRFSPSTTRSDWTNTALGEIRGLYNRYTDQSGATQVNLQGIVFDTNGGGRIPLERYVAATIEVRDVPNADLAAIAKQRGLSPKYLASLLTLLKSPEPSPILDPIRARWRGAAVADAASLTTDIHHWQAVLTKFQSVGHMKAWMVAASPLVTQQEIRFKIPAPAAGEPVTLSLVAGTAGDGGAGDQVVWQNARLVRPGRPDLPLRDVRDFTREMSALRSKLFASTAKALAAAEEAARLPGPIDADALAAKHAVDSAALKTWLAYLGISGEATLQLDHFTDRLDRAGNYDFVRGWGKAETPNLMANSSDEAVRIPGKMKGHGVVVHPTPTLATAIGWQSPVDATVTIESRVQHAHPECGNGVTWGLELRRGATRQRLAGGIAHGPAEMKSGPIQDVAVRKGDLVSIVIGPRDGNHSCDLTDVELVIRTSGDAAKEWNLTADVSPDILAGNPHSDRQGNPGVWHFYTEPVQAGAGLVVIPAGSVLARWQSAANAEQRSELAAAVQTLLTGAAPVDAASPDGQLHRQLASLSGPLFANVPRAPKTPDAVPPEPGEAEWGLDPALFGRAADGTAMDAGSLAVTAPSNVTFRLPADLAVDSELVVTGTLDPKAGRQGSVQLEVAARPLEPSGDLRPGIPVVTAAEGETRVRYERAFDEFRQWLPAALCYTKIVPVDEVVTLTLFHREDEPLVRLMLTDAEQTELERLWGELHYVSQDALTLVDAFAQLLEYASQDSDPKLFEPFRKPIHDRADEFRRTLLTSEPKHLDDLIAFAARVYRRPLAPGEAAELRSLYGRLRSENLPHEEAFRFTLARLFVAPAFLYRLEAAPSGPGAGDITPTELASRLSYFLWSSEPDDALSQAAARGELARPEQIVTQTRRLLADPKGERFAREFACQWLHVYDFDTLDEKSERHFPEFPELRASMHEETVRFFAELIHRDGTVLDLLEADFAMVNEPLAKFYGLSGVSGPEWRRVDGVRQAGRGGILGLASTLAKQSGASRTSPILRGNWVSEVLLGEKLPKPPKDVPLLPEDEASETLTVRQLVEKHTSDERCAHCHVRIDPLGFSLEAFDAIGRRREKDLAQRPIDARSKLQDGTELAGIDGLRHYLAEIRRDAFVRQFCRKLLGYALGRGVQLSDEPLLDEIQEKLKQDRYRIAVAIEAIVQSPQFRQIRGRDSQLARE